MQIDLTLPRPHEKQKLILASPADRIAINGGRRGGKTITFGGLISVPHFLSGGYVLYGAPKAGQTNAFWGYCKKYLRPLIDKKLVKCNETERIITWAIQGKEGQIHARTAYDADTWRSGWGDLLIFDEYAYMNPNAWEQVGAPMLLDKGGKAYFGSSPNRKNHFFALYQKEYYEAGWQSFHLTSLDNPHLNQEALAQMTRDMTEDNYRQEILAEFLDNSGAVFRNIEACHQAQHTRPDEHAGHNLIAGIDWGKKDDFTVISVGCVDCRSEVELTRFGKIDYTYQRDHIIEIWNKWGISQGIAESNAMGEPNIEALYYSNIPIQGFAMTGVSKPPLIQRLVLALEKGEIQFLNDRVARSEMEAYEIKINSVTGRGVYSAPAGVHDDTVIARALMYHAMANSWWVF